MLQKAQSTFPLFFFPSICPLYISFFLHLFFDLLPFDLSSLYSFSFHVLFFLFRVCFAEVPFF